MTCFWKLGLQPIFCRKNKYLHDGLVTLCRNYWPRHMIACTPRLRTYSDTRSPNGLRDPSRALSVLRRLKILGVKIAMDDFGTGYASLSSLQSFPFDKIKIDRTFVSCVESNGQSGAIVRAVIGLGNALKMPVIAEGVETEDERAFLMREGCEEIQGYLVGRRRPIASYAALTEGVATTVHAKAVAG
jgi:predicted signal transduction protein with EAL and GGDEF domain